jgi:uncharacterized protein YecE (DUF72 family)
MKSPRILIGTGAFAYAEWKGRFYPKDLPASEAVAFYAQLFSAVELNNTFYRMSAVESSQKWVQPAPDDFLFAIKVPQQITHFRRLNNCSDLLKTFFGMAKGFGKKLGPVNFQLPSNFKLDLQRLESFLDLLPSNFRVAFEFRHPSWLVDPVYQLLRKKKICLVFNDTDIEMPLMATTDWGYLRLRRLKYTDTDLKNWAKRIKKQPWKDALVIFKHEEKVTAPKLAERFKALI